MLKSVSILTIAFFAVVSLGLVPPTFAEDNLLRMIPMSNGIVIRVRNPAALIDRMCVLADALEAEFPSSDEDAEKIGWGNGLRQSIPFDGFQEWGLDVRRDWWLYCSNPFSEDAQYTYLLPLSDSEQFRSKSAEEFKTPYSIHNDLVFIGPTDEIEAIKKCLAGEMDSIENRMSPDARAVFDQGDIGLLIDIRHLINANLVVLLAAPEILKMMAGDPTITFNNDQSKNFVQKALDIGFQSLSALELTTISINVDADGIRFDQYIGVQERSNLASFFQNNPGADMALLTSLPSSSAVYVGLNGNWKSLFRGLSQLAKWSSPNDQKETLEAQLGLLREYEQLNYGSVAYAYPMRPFDQGLLRSMTIIEVDQPDRLRELANRAEQLGDRLGPMKRTIVRRATENLSDHQVDVRHLGPVFQMAQNGVPAPDLMSEIDTWLYGPEGNVERTIYLKDRVLQFNGGSKVRTAAALRHAINPENENRDANPSFLKTRNKLGEKPNLVVMAETGTLASALVSNFEQLYVPIMFGAFGMMNGGAAPVALAVENVDLVADVEPADEKMDDDDASTPSDAPESSDPKDSEEGEEEAEVRVVRVRVAQERVDLGPSMKIDPAKLESLYENPSFIGFSMTFEPQGCRMRTVVPIESIKHFVRAGGILMESFEAAANREDEEDANGVDMPPKADDE